MDHLQKGDFPSYKLQFIGDFPAGAHRKDQPRRLEFLALNHGPDAPWSMVTHGAGILSYIETPKVAQM